MFVAIYRDKETGKIVNVHSIQKLSEIQIEEVAMAHNKAQSHTNSMTVYCIDENSLEEILATCCAFNKNCHGKALESISNSFDDLVREMKYFNDSQKISDKK